MYPSHIGCGSHIMGFIPIIRGRVYTHSPLNNLSVNVFITPEFFTVVKCLSEVIYSYSICLPCGRMKINVFYVMQILARNYKRVKFMKATKCPHPYLKEVEVQGYTGHRNDDELIIYIVENAISLEKIIFRSFWYKRSCRN